MKDSKTLLQNPVKQKFSESLFPSQDQIPEPDKIALEIINEASAFLAQKYDIHPCGIGMSGKFKCLEIEFQVFRSLSRDQVRLMLFDSTEVFLNKINSSVEIKEFLEVFPFTLKNIGITFYMYDKTHHDLFHPDICVASWTQSGVDFWTRGSENRFRFKEKIKETHEQAISLAKKYKAEIAKAEKEQVKLKAPNHG